MTLRSLSLAAAIGTALALIVAYLLLRFGVFLPYAERQVLHNQNQELQRLHTNLRSWMDELENQNHDWIISGAALPDGGGRQRLLTSSVVDSIFIYDNSLVVRYQRSSADLDDSLFSQDEGAPRARLMPWGASHQPQWKRGLVDIDGVLYGYSSGTLCKPQLQRCDLGYLVLLRKFTAQSLRTISAGSGLVLSTTVATASDNGLPRFPHQSDTLMKQRRLVLVDDSDKPLRVLQVQHQSSPPNRYSRIEWLVLLVSLVPAALIYWLLMHMIAKPMERGVKALRAMERQQQHRAIMSPSILKEFRQLAQIFNGLLRRLSQQQEELASLSRRDQLTGLANAQALQVFVAQEWRRCLRYRRGLALILIEIKPLASATEATSSEEAAVVFSRVLRSFCRRGGELGGRDSNGIFSLVLAEVDEHQLKLLLQRVWERSAELSPFDREPARLQIAIGASLIPAGYDVKASGLTQSDWAENANNALYQCKQTGVGGWRVWCISRPGCQCRTP